MEQKNYEKALNLALYYLSLKARTRKELKDKLLEKGHEENVVDQVMTFLESKKWVDDLGYAKQYLESTNHRYGAYRLKQYLKQKGVESSVIEAAFYELEDEENLEDESVRARQVLEKKINATIIDWALIESDYAYKSKFYRKFCQFLLNRGFSGDCVKKVVGERLAQEFFDEL